MSGSEIVAIVDERNAVIGTATRSEMRARNLAHRATYILVLDGSGSVFLQKRTLTKDVFPGYYDVAAGGVVLAGEDYETAARRELAEELGIEGVPLAHGFDFLYEDGRHTVWGRAYRCAWHGPVRLQPEEIESGAFEPIDRVLAGDFKPLTPDGEYVLRRFVSAERAPDGA